MMMTMVVVVSYVGLRLSRPIQGIEGEEDGVGSPSEMREERRRAARSGVTVADARFLWSRTRAQPVCNEYVNWAGAGLDKDFPGVFTPGSTSLTTLSISGRT